MTTRPIDEALFDQIPESPASITAPELLERIGRHIDPPSLRTVQRALERLRHKTPALECEQSKPHRWYFKAGAKRGATTRLDPAAALAFSLIEQHLDGLIPAPFRADLEPLFRKANEIAQNLPQTHLERWKARTTTTPSAFPLRLPRVDPDILRKAQTALLDRSQLVIVYRKPLQETPREHRLHPQGLILADGVFYLLATVGDYSDAVHFALHRIERADVSSQRSRDIPDFNADDYARRKGGMLFLTGNTLKLRLRAREFLPAHLSERPLSDDQSMKELADGWWQVSATVPESEQLEWWLGSFGPQVEVLAPARLRRRMADWAWETHALYSTRSKLQQ